MREFEYDFEEGFSVGLRKHHKNPRNSQACIEALNVKVSKSGLEPYTLLTNPFAAQLMEWPYPLILEGAERSYLCVRSVANQSVIVYEIQADYSLVQVFEVDDATYGTGYSRPEVADFVSFQVMAFGNAVLVYDPTSGNVTDVSSFGVTVPTVRTCCQFRGQFIYGCVTSSFHDCDEGFVGWSEIGSLNCEPSAKNTAGYRPMPRGGTVYRVMELGKSVIVYSDREIATLNPVSGPAPTFAFDDLLSIGIVSKGAVGGDEQQHLFVDRVGWLWKLTKDGKLDKLGYQEFLSEMDGENIVVSYDRFDKDFYISDGNVCYLYSEAGGLTQVHQLPLSIAEVNSQLVTMCADTGEREARVVTDTFDFGFRPLKTIYTVEVGTHGGGFAEGAWDYRNHRRHDFYRTELVELNNLGIMTQVVSGNDFRLVIRASDYSSFFLDYAKIRWKMTDLRSVRGLPGARTGT